MRELSYRIVNVFAEATLAGNPLCVFDDATANALLTEVEMQALALQFNLSETTFVLPSSVASARVRIFTPTFEMAFAGHPTLGSAQVVRETLTTSDSLTLEMKAGVIPVRAQGTRWELRANTPSNRAVEKSDPELAAMLGLDADDVLTGARWISTGSEQLIVPLASVDAVKRTQPNASLLLSLSSNIGRSMAYVFAPSAAGELYSGSFL